MDNKIKKLVEKGILIAGVLNREEDGFVSADRIDDVDEILRLEQEGKEIYFATKSMGRSIFTINKDGQIENYKGVDSGLGGGENFVTGMTDTRFVIIDNPISGKRHEISLRTEPDSRGRRKAEVRFKGASPLEDLEEEADVNEDLFKMGVKVPYLKSVREYSPKVAAKLGLPVHIDGDYSDLEEASDYSEEARKRKEKISLNSNIEYVDELKPGKRPELLMEYFKRLGLLERPELITFIEEEAKISKKSDLTVEDAIGMIDKSYSLGQRYGQAVRILESPFRIADIQGYIENGDVESLDAIADFTESTLPECNEGKGFELVFANQFGKNVAIMFNNGWMFKNFAHRQDYSLTGEMCDDSYMSLKQAVANINNPDPNKVQGMIEQYNEYYKNQIIFASSMVKTLQDEMEVRGKQDSEISMVLDEFVDSLVNNINIDEMAEYFGRPKEVVIKSVMDFLDTSKVIKYDKETLPDRYEYEEGKRDYVLELAKKIRPTPEFDDSVVNANIGYRDYYRTVADKLSNRLKLRLLSEGYINIGVDTDSIKDAEEIVMRGMEQKTNDGKNHDIK